MNERIEPGAGGGDGPGPVVAVVVDDPDVRGRKDGPQVIDRPADHLFLVQRRHEQVPGQGVRIPRRPGPVPRERQHDDQDIGDERDAHQQGDRLGQRHGDLDGRTVHERVLQCRGRKKAVTRRPSREETMAVRSTRLMPMQTMLTSDPRIK